MPQPARFASAGHKLGQIVGDWYEEFFTQPMLEKIAASLKLDLHSRFINNSRTKWRDSQGNEVNYDFVMCLPGSQMPVAFFETFWRRGARHSKDKSRDDCGKLLPMRNAFSTIRMLSIIAAGDFTAPAREFVQLSGIELFYIAKSFIIEAWKVYGFNIDYKDNLDESHKLFIVNDIENKLSSSPSLRLDIAATLFNFSPIYNQIKAYELLVCSKLSASPVEYKITMIQKSFPQVFISYNRVDEFLHAHLDQYRFRPEKIVYSYEVDFGNGDSYIKDDLNFDQLMTEHTNLKKLIQHMENL